MRSITNLISFYTTSVYRYCMLLVYSFVHYSIAHINLFLFIYFGKLPFDCFFVMLDLVGFFFCSYFYCVSPEDFA